MILGRGNEGGDQELLYGILKLAIVHHEHFLTRQQQQNSEYSISKSAVIYLTAKGLNTLKVSLVLAVFNLVQK